MNPVPAVESTIFTPYLNMDVKEHQTARYIIAQNAIVLHCAMHTAQCAMHCAIIVVNNQLSESQQNADYSSKRIGSCQSKGLMC